MKVSAELAYVPAQICDGCLAMMNATIEGNAPLSGALFAYCTHRSVARLVLLHMGVVIEKHSERSSSEKIAQKRSLRYVRARLARIAP